MLNFFQCFCILHYVFTSKAAFYTCETPNKWLSGNYHVNLRNGIPLIQKGQLWPEAIVKYRFHPSLAPEDRTEVLAAFEEYHQKTCVRFEPARYNDSSFVSFEIDNNICSEADVCMQGGYQFVKLGKNCINRAAIIHQLGHTLCLQHEHQRADRDTFVSFSQECQASQKFSSCNGFYDFASQMHFPCGSCLGGWSKNKDVTKCGPQTTPGLSVLDVDYINKLYNCQGCHSHRWIRKSSVTESTVKQMPDFGYKDLNGELLHPCRAFVGEELAIGTYKHSSGNCSIGHYIKELNLTKNFEVLTFPKGLKSEAFEYNLTPYEWYLTYQEAQSILKNALVAGYLPMDNGTVTGNGYVMFANLMNFPYRDVCPNLFSWRRMLLGSIGKMFDYGKIRAYTTFCNKEITVFNHCKILTCKSTGSQEIRPNVPKRDYKECSFISERANSQMNSEGRSQSSAPGWSGMFVWSMF